MISIPEVRSNGGVYRVEFPSERVWFSVENVGREGRAVKGELTVMTSAPELDAYIFGPTDVSLMGPRTPSIVAKECRQQCKSLEHLDWERMVSRGFRDIVRLEREGEPVVDLAKHQVDERVTNRLDPILPDHKPSLIFAYGGVGKTLIACNYFSVMMATGIQSCDFNPEPCNVLLLDYESDPDENKERDEAVARGFGISLPKDRIFYLPCYQSLTRDVQRIQRLVLDKDIGFIVVDSAAPACGGEAENAEATAKYFNALRSLRVATLTLAHIPKTGDKNPFGSVFWTNYPRAVYKLTSNQKPGASTYTLGLIQTKVNWGSRLRPIGIKVTHEDGAVMFAKTDMSGDPELSKDLSISDRIEAALKMGKQNVEYIAESMDEKPATVRATLNRYKDRRFLKIGNDWGVLGEYE